METFCNMQTFGDKYNNNEKIPKKLIELLVFISFSKINRYVISKLPCSNIRVSNATSDENYIFKYNGKTYPFSVFSDRELQKIDRKNLESMNRIKAVLFRTLKLACSMDLVNPRIVVGNSVAGIFSLLIMFQEHGIDKVIDYSTNLIMSKEDYYEVFNFSELNIVDKVDLYNIYYIMNKFDDFEHILEYLIFTKEIFNELAQKDYFKFLAEKYDEKGINRRNYIFLGSDSDCLFFHSEDDHHMKYNKLIDELNDFTENPTRKSKHITYDKEKDKYMLKAINFGYFTFDLLSNLIANEEIKDKLLSRDRYGKCHVNNNKAARSLSEKDKASAYIVGGKFKANEKDYFYHSWVEIDEKNTVIDYNHNIVMDRDAYYKLFEIVPISKVSVLEMEDIIQTVFYDAGFNIPLIYLNYFGPELMKDLKKNEAILKK